MIDKHYPDARQLLLGFDGDRELFPTTPCCVCGGTGWRIGADGAVCPRSRYDDNPQTPQPQHVAETANALLARSEAVAARNPGRSPPEVTA